MIRAGGHRIATCVPDRGCSNRAAIISSKGDAAHRFGDEAAAQDTRAYSSKVADFADQNKQQERTTKHVQH